MIKTTRKASVLKERQIRRLQSLTPTEFENLIFDLMVSRGMTNVSWRTPGADGGRDIEGTTIDKDLSGTQVIKKWFIECKRYASSVDWPTIYTKLAYADSHQADVLLLCTTSKFSPMALTHVENWNSRRRSIAIRLWPRHELELQLQQHPDLMLKYGLSHALSTPGKSIVALALALSKSVSSHYSRLVFDNFKPDLMLQASQAIADLLSRRMEDIEHEGRIRVSFPTSTANTIENCDFTGDKVEIDEAGLRAFLAYLVALSNDRVAVQIVTSTSCRITSRANLVDLIERYRPVFAAISMWGDFEFDVAKSAIVVSIRQRQ